MLLLASILFYYFGPTKVCSIIKNANVLFTEAVATSNTK